eukprot:2738802-Alexandrium_andersonii.AAC.1
MASRSAGTGARRARSPGRRQFGKCSNGPPPAWQSAGAASRNEGSDRTRKAAGTAARPSPRQPRAR